VARRSVTAGDRLRGKTVDQGEDQLLSQIEQAALGHIREFPDANDEQIATLLRDDLLNYRVKDPRAFKWATVETVARMRRNVFRAVRAQVLAETNQPAPRPAPTSIPKPAKAKTPKQLAAKKSRPPVIRAVVCPSCGKKTRGDDYRCMHCARPVRTDGRGD
jgi:hypothetical protein